MQLGCIFIHPRVYEISRVHGFCTSCFSFEVWLHHSTMNVNFVILPTSTIYTCIVDLEISMLENGRMVNFHAEKFSFIGSTPHHVNINSARVFVRLIFIAAINYDNIFAMNTSRFMVAENFHRRKFHQTQLHILPLHSRNISQNLFLSWGKGHHILYVMFNTGQNICGQKFHQQ